MTEPTTSAGTLPAGYEMQPQVQYVQAAPQYYGEAMPAGEAQHVTYAAPQPASVVYVQQPDGARARVV